MQHPVSMGWVTLLTHLLFCHQLTGYENDFKMERGEKQKALSDLEKMSRGRDHVIQSYEQLKKEHIGLRQNIERMYSQAQAQQQQVGLLSWLQ